MKGLGKFLIGVGIVVALNVFVVIGWVIVDYPYVKPGDRYFAIGLYTFITGLFVAAMAIIVGAMLVEDDQ